MTEIKARGGDATFVAGDVNDEASVRRQIEFAVSKYGRLDLAVNNAGIAEETKTIGDSDPAPVSGADVADERLWGSISA